MLNDCIKLLIKDSSRVDLNALMCKINARFKQKLHTKKFEFVYNNNVNLNYKGNLYNVIISLDRVYLVFDIKDLNLYTRIKIPFKMHEFEKDENYLGEICLFLNNDTPHAKLFNSEHHTFKCKISVIDVNETDATLSLFIYYPVFGDDIMRQHSYINTTIKDYRKYIDSYDGDDDLICEIDSDNDCKIMLHTAFEVFL